MNRDFRVYLIHIVERLERIHEYTVGGEHAFHAQPMIQDAVIRNFEIIGEAAKRIPEDFRNAHPAIPWRQLAAFRDVLIHQYEGVSLPEVWQIIHSGTRELHAALLQLLPPRESWPTLGNQ